MWNARHAALFIGAVTALVLLAPEIASAGEEHGSSHVQANVQTAPATGPTHQQHPATPRPAGAEGHGGHLQPDAGATPATGDEHAGHTMTGEAAAVPKDRPRLLVLTAFLAANLLVLAAAALVRRRDRRAPGRRRPAIRTETSRS